MLDRGSGGRGGGMEEAGHVELFILYAHIIFINTFIIYNYDQEVVGWRRRGTSSWEFVKIIVIIIINSKTIHHRQTWATQLNLDWEYQEDRGIGPCLSRSAKKPEDCKVIENKSWTR